MKHTARVLVAVTEDQYARCVKYIEEKGEQVPDTMGFPTIYLEDESGKIVGVMATKPDAEFVICNKAIADSGPRMLQLIDAYELALRRNGATGYHIPLTKRAPKLRAMMERHWGIEPWGEDNAHIWYTRQIPVPPTSERLH